jgi:hypothetical protein
MTQGGRSDQLDVPRVLLDLTNRVRALEATPLFNALPINTGPFILMLKAVAGVPANTATDLHFTQIEAAGDENGATTTIPSPFANAYYSFDTGVDDTVVTVLMPGGYIASFQCWFGVDPNFPTVDFNAYVRKTGQGGGHWATPQPTMLWQQKFFAAFNFSPSIPNDNAGIDIAKPFVFTPVEIGVGITFGIQIAHDHAGGLDCAAALMLVKLTDDWPIP